MGCCLSVEQVEGKERNKEIDTQIKRDRINMRKEIKMLLLGKQFPPPFSFVAVTNPIFQVRVNQANRQY